MVLTEQAPYKLFGNTEDEVWRWLHLERERCPFLRDYLPGLPDDPDFEKAWVGSSGAEMLSKGFDIYKLFKDLYEQYAHAGLTPESRVLDFGCGFGRVIRFFSREVAPENLIGIDASERALAACPNRWCQLQHCERFPPTNLEVGFDLIYAFSVFSHLSEQAHLAWLKEFKRLLRPDGVLILTTFHRDYLATGADLADFSPLEKTLAAYDRGEYCYRPLVHGSHFGRTFIPEPYARERWPFCMREYFDTAWGQSIVVCTN